MTSTALNIVFLGLTLTSSWGNGHAAIYRGLIRELVLAGHRVLFLERNRPWHAVHPDPVRPAFGRHELYETLEDLKARFAAEIKRAEVVIVGSSLDDGNNIGEWVLRLNKALRVFYDLDAPATAGRLFQHDCDYLAPDQLGRYDLYLSACDGPVLEQLRAAYAVPCSRPFYSAIDPNEFYQEPQAADYDLGCMLHQFDPEQRPLWEKHFWVPAGRVPNGRFIQAGPNLFRQTDWPENLIRIQYLAPIYHRNFYNALRFYLDLPKPGRCRCSFSPGTRLLQAAACGTPVIAEPWPGLDRHFIPGKEILISRSSEATEDYLRQLPEAERRKIGEAGRERVLAEHTLRRRVQELEQCFREASGDPAGRLPVLPAPPEAVGREPEKSWPCRMEGG